MGLILPGNERRWASYDLEVAEKIGLNEAIILAQMIRSIEGHIDGHLTDKFFRDGRWWMYDSMPSLSKSTTLGIDAIRRTITKLKSLQIIHMVQYELAEGYGRYWYAIDSEVLVKCLKAPPPKQNQRVGTTCAKPQGGGMQNHRVGGAKPQGGTLAKPHGLTITPNTNIPITHTITPDPAPVIALPIKKPRVKKDKPPISPDILELAKAWLAYAKEATKTKPYASWNDQSFGENLEKVMKATGLNLSKMWEILTFVKGDTEFWRPNATSPDRLLTISKTNGKKKIDNILDSIERTKQNKGGRYEQRPQARDYSADNGKFDSFDDKTPWAKG